MSSLLQQLNIFELRPLVTNFNCKLSTITDYDARKQMLCLVSEENDVVLRYTSEGGQEVLKLISWFRRTNRVIHDVCFDPSGTWLLVLCFDNTLHIVPALAVVDKTYLDASNSYQPQPYSHTQVTSYIIPFVGPHECPNSKKCPNRTNIINTENVNKQQIVATTSPTEVLSNKSPTPDQENKDTSEETKESTTAENEYEIALKSLDDFNIVTLPAPEEHKLEAFSHDMPTHMLASNATPYQNEDTTGNSHVMATSFMASKTCPYPLSVVWWQTIDGMNRAIIGYSDGSICFVGLSPNCPFVASTTIQTGSVVKLLICKDITFESVMLLITSSLKQQFKLLLEQKTIKYIYPGDSSPSANQSRENDWQIVMPLKTNSNCSDPASDSSQLDEDVFIKNDDLPNMATGTSVVSTTVPANTTALNLSKNNNAGSNIHTYTSSSQLPPPPPYSVAINRHVESAPLATGASMSYSTSTTSSGVRFQQQIQQLPDLDDINGRAGILPAARARLASLKSLGSKKLNAIKMRLSDNRQKLEEYIPENTIGSFAIMDSPSLKPEILGNSIGSFYTIQNLRSTYLLSALHCQSNRLSVHSIDINLKPLFLYKIPKNCFDILISSNILYSIQYVDIKGDELLMAKDDNTEKENRDTEIEKEEKYADEKLQHNNESSDICEKVAEESSSKESVDTSATTSVPSTYDCMSPSNSINSVGVISSAMASLRTGDEDKYNTAATLAMFRFEHETVLNLYQMATYRTNELNEIISKEEKAKAFDYKDIRSPMDYVNFYETADIIEEYSLRQMEIMQTEFPKINYDPCYVVTNKNVYYIQLKKEPFAIFLDAALANEWMQCREFCNTFDLTYETCIEFAGDYLLRRKRVTQALVTYNNARIKPIRTALKLAMFGQTNALMHLCAMALKATYLLKGTHFCTAVIKGILSDITYRHSEDVRKVLPTDVSNKAGSKTIVNEGALCSNYVYGVDESISNLQMSPSSQFHLANLLLITLAEKAVNDKNYLPLWNFIVTNNKYHANMTSIVLCQSGLYSSALLLAKTRGVCIDTFLALTSVVGQEFELNVCLYNLSEDIFTETITYMPQISVDYFLFLQEKLKNIRTSVLKRLQQQLNPFSAILRPVVSHTSTHMGHILNDNNTYLFEFCKNLIETYIAVLIHIESQRSKTDHITNALSTFRLNYEDNQFAIESSRFKPISAGCAHCACIVDGIAYFWGSNGVPCNYNVNKSSDPPDPPHAVKSLDLLSQLNLEVHAVKCGRQHTLVLTNNGLYTFGNNNYSQLGIGNGMQMSLQPMLVKKFDGKNITILEAGQYHNAAVADGLLYTWGWGIYGQLGHGDTENIAVPKIVSFFKYKKVVQVSLGHAHTLVLCQAQQREIENQCNELYVFGSNHFGQLGLGAQIGDNANPAADDDLNCATQVKSLIPIKLDISDAKIRLIHTKFFTNLAVDENNRMFTWGSSPQALRLANQIKRRANAKQKLEENQRREISKRFEATLSTNSGCILLTKPTETVVPVTVPTTTNIDTITTVSKNTATIDAEDISNKEVCISDKAENTASNTTTTSTILSTAVKALEEEFSEIVPTRVHDNNTLKEHCVAESTPHISDAPESDATISIEIISEDVEEFEQATTSPLKEPFNVTVKEQEEVPEDSRINTPPQKQQSTENDPCEHMSPHLVDTSEVAGEILQISSGLFHFALISSTCTLYTWGKNLEHQLGTEDKERRTVIKPLPVDSIESPMYVDCGADFTVVMTTEHIVKAFGGNSNGQCGRDLGTAIDRVKQRVVCLPTTKRLMRFESQCVEVPVEINLPRPRIRLDTEPVRYLKSIPDFQPHFVQEADINIDDATFEQPSPSDQYKSTTQADSSEKVASGQDSEDLISSLENISNNDVSSANFSNNASPVAVVENEQSGSYDFTPEEQSYARLATTEYADQSMAAVQQLENEVAANAATGVRTAQDSVATETDGSELQLLRNYIHYCLYVFHGLYNPDKVRDFAKERREYRVRTCMLNFKFVDAFVLCLQDCDTANKSLKIFEYFTKDTSFVPMHRQDLKYLVYYLMLHFLERKFDMLQCERFFLADLDFYLLELAYVLYFNNNNTVLEQTLNQKLKYLIAQEQSDANKMKNQNNEQTHKLEYTDALFDSLSVKFKTIICQRLVKYCESNIC
ncbi:uncharacterized protein LOC119685097 isoform X2 [Teleopsis dalmanni]|uniref:uncharacterized protein LOC119685097 isoform X2 n=1 Tax=Teleopsis dalmanni TaxID=139649 RepID=UPI0018CDD413|nr:uncharacterized protein LOC119685097 isoform X2 [Teleopsis dalmanni]